jgi:hypothetical protein
MLGVLIFGIFFARQHGWQEPFTVLLILDTVITVLYVWLCSYNRRWIKRIASMSPEDQQSIVEKMPPLVKGVLNRELKK